jgi:hypothetical protein
VNQPTKDLLKDQLALAADALIQERIKHAMAIRHMELRLLPPLSRPWWRRWFR